ncbi:SH3 domain-containing protein, partial [Arthrospira platensis SPKY1]|nr:SH3 domain-containing protein [Arthrospira platensis SPKY1]
TAASLSAAFTPTATTQPPTFTAVPSPTATPTPTAAPTRAQTPTIGPVETTPPTVRILLSSVNLRTGPGVAYPVSGFLLLDQQATVLAKSRDGNWYLVELPDGKRGWLASSVAEPLTPLDGVTIALTIPARPTNTPLPATAPPTAPPPPPRTATEPPPPPPPTSTARPPTPTPEPTAYPYPYP